MSSRVSGSLIFPFSLTLSLTRSPLFSFNSFFSLFLRRLPWRSCLACRSRFALRSFFGSRASFVSRACRIGVMVQGPQGPTLRLWKLSSPSHWPGWQVRNSVRLGQAEPPKSGGARTKRKRFCKPIPQLLEQDVHGENSDTTQSRGQGIRQACSNRGLGSKYSQMASSAGTPSDLCTQPTSRVWMPSSPRVHTAGLGTPALRIDTGTHWFQAPSCQSYSSLCQSHTRKQLCWFLGRCNCWQLVCNVVQPSEWAHHTARL